MTSFFVGSKTSPSFLVDTSRQKQVIIYKPDKHSKNEEDFYEKYSLGKIVVDTLYDDIAFFKKPVTYRKTSKYVPEVIIKMKGKHFLISDTIKQLYQ